MTATDSPASTEPVKSSPNPFETLTVGQTLEGTCKSAKQFGIFVDVSMGADVLLPRSVLSKTNYEKLKKLAETRSKEKVKVELVTVSAENRTLSGKFVSPNYKKDRSDLTALDGKELASQFFNATVISSHDFGIFAELDDYGVEGLVPASKLPDRASGESIQSAFPSGKSVVVQIEDMNVGDKKLVMSMKFESRPEVGEFEGVPPTRWFEGVVQSVSSFGLFVRPAGHDATGLVHGSRVPRDLIAQLKKAAPIQPGTNKTDIEALFSEKDVIRFRVHSVNPSSRRLELSMLPYKASDDEEDDYIVEGREPEGEETMGRDMEDDDEDSEEYDASSTLLWWRGQPYGNTESDAGVEDEETEILNENAQVIEGTWRRMFEVDMREDELDFSSKIEEEERKELEEELGELMGLDEDMGDDFLDFGSKFKVTKFGSQVSIAGLPEEWKSQMDFFKELDSYDSLKTSALKRGKTMEQEQFDSLLREVELELDNAASRAPRKRVDTFTEPPEDDAPKAVTAAEESVPPVEE